MIIKQMNNNRKIIKKILILLSLVAAIITVYEIADIYAVFHSESSGTLSQDIAKWKIVVNGTNIATEEVQTFEINELNMDENTTNGKFTPGMTGSFEIEIEPKDTRRFCKI